MKISSQILIDIIEEEVYNVLKEGIFTDVYRDQLRLARSLSDDDPTGKDTKKLSVSKRDIQFVQMYLKSVIDVSFKNLLKKNLISVLSKSVDTNKELLLQVYMQHIQNNFQQSIAKEAIDPKEYKKLKGILVILETLIRDSKIILESFRRKLDEIYNKNPLASGLFKKKGETVNQIKKESELLLKGVNGFLAKMANDKKAKVKEYENTVIKSAKDFKDLLQNGEASEIIQNIKQKYGNDFASMETSTGISEEQLKEILGSKIHQEMLNIEKISDMQQYLKSLEVTKEPTKSLKTLGVKDEQIKEIVAHYNKLKQKV